MGRRAANLNCIAEIPVEARKESNNVAETESRVNYLGYLSTVGGFAVVAIADNTSSFILFFYEYIGRLLLHSSRKSGHVTHAHNSTFTIFSSREKHAAKPDTP
jgi:hypothetical protein